MCSHSMCFRRGHAHGRGHGRGRPWYYSPSSLRDLWTATISKLPHTKVRRKGLQSGGVSHWYHGHPAHGLRESGGCSHSMRFRRGHPCGRSHGKDGHGTLFSVVALRDIVAETEKGYRGQDPSKPDKCPRDSRQDAGATFPPLCFWAYEAASMGSGDDAPGE